MNGQISQIRDVRVTGPEIVECDPNAVGRQLLQLRARAVEIVKKHVLSDLHHERLGREGQRREQRRRSPASDPLLNWLGDTFTDRCWIWPDASQRRPGTQAARIMRWNISPISPHSSASPKKAFGVKTPRTG